MGAGYEGDRPDLGYFIQTKILFFRVEKTRKEGWSMAPIGQLMTYERRLWREDASNQKRTDKYPLWGQFAIGQKDWKVFRRCN